MRQCWKLFQRSTSCQYDATWFWGNRVFGGSVVPSHSSIASWIAVTGSSTKQQTQASLPPWLRSSAYVAAMPAPGTWDDPDPELLMDFLALGGTCLITVDLSGGWDCCLTLVTINAALGWALQASLVVPLSSWLTLPCGKLPPLPLTLCKDRKRRTGR